MELNRMIRGRLKSREGFGSSGKYVDCKVPWIIGAKEFYFFHHFLALVEKLMCPINKEEHEDKEAEYFIRREEKR